MRAMRYYSGVLVLLFCCELLVPGVGFTDALLTETRNFQSCVRGGGKVVNTTPRTCVAADGVEYPEEAEGAECLRSFECGAGALCRNRRCVSDRGDNFFSTSCSSSLECGLVNQEWGWDCCRERCENPVDYSAARWIAVNRSAYDKERSKVCEGHSQRCKTAPVCPPSVDRRYGVECLNGSCIKISTGMNLDRF